MTFTPTPEVTSRDVERFWSKVDKDAAAPCWLWTAGLYYERGTRTYGSFTFPRGNGGWTTTRAYRWAWEQEYGPVPDGLVLDHLCRVPACVNPAHLEAVSNTENILRGVGAPAQNARKTHCVHGHPFSGDNLILEGKRRRCRICANEKARRTYRRKHGLPAD